MNLSPELQLLIVNALILSIAYGGIYPSMKTVTYKRMVVADLVLTALSLTVAAGLFWGTGVSLSLILFEVNWFVFSLLTTLVLEWPLFRWFCRKHGLPPFRIEDDR